MNNKAINRNTHEIDWNLHCDLYDFSEQANNFNKFEFNRQREKNKHIHTHTHSHIYRCHS